MDQQQAFDVVSKGHNAFVTGKAGAGKTFLLSHIYDFFKASKKIFVTCTTGIACKNLPSYLQPTTLHSFAGIKECRSSSYTLLEQVKRNSDAIERWKNVDVLIIDEVSMLSKKVFDSIEFIGRKLRENTYHFGGIQLIASGEFYQLPPVPNPMNEDAGGFAFTSCVWDKVFPHNFIMDKIERQHDDEFISFLNEIRIGRCSSKSREFAKTMARPVDPKSFGVDHVVRIYQLNDDVDYYNFEKLETLPGEMYVRKACDIGNKNVLNRYNIKYCKYSNIQCRDGFTGVVWGCAPSPPPCTGQRGCYFS